LRLDVCCVILELQFCSTAPITPGETLTLTIGDDYWSGYYSEFAGALPAGTPVYAQVDSVNLDSDYGGVLEIHEMTGGVYNNISRVVLLTPLNISPATTPAQGTPYSTTLADDLPLRPQRRVSTPKL
jgi:hypothetical protein